MRRRGLEAGTEDLLNVHLELGTGQDSPEFYKLQNLVGWGMKR